MFKRLFLFVITVSFISASIWAMEDEQQPETKKVKQWNREQLGKGTFFESFALRKGNGRSPREFKAVFQKNTSNRKELRSLWQNVFESITVTFGTIKDPVARFKFFFDVNQATAILKNYLTPIIRNELTPIIKEELISEGKIRERNAWYTTLLGGTALFGGGCISGWFLKNWWENRQNN